MLQERLASQVQLATPTGKRSSGRPKTRWCDYISDLVSSRLGVEPAKLPDITENREVFRARGAAAPWPSPEELGHENEWMKVKVEK